MAERKNLAALITTPDPQPAASITRSDSSARPDSPANDDRPAAPVPPERPAATGGMTMRSWYMPKGSADQLAALVDDVHFATRLPKHLIMGAAVNVLGRHRDEIEAEAKSAAGNG
jgi:hypothetical protein